MLKEHRSVCLVGALLLAALCLPDAAWSQCSFSNFFNSTIVLSGDQPETVACVQGGQYVDMGVVSGETYRLSTCTSSSGGDSQLTLFNSANTAISVGYNDDDCGVFSTVSYTAAFTGTLYAQVNEYSCTGSTTCYTLEARCMTCGVAPGAGCAYRLDLFDSFGDGWNGASLAVFVNGVTLNDFTLSNGSGATFDFAVDPGDQVTLSFDSGEFDDEITYDFSQNLDEGYEVLFQDGPSPVVGTVFTTQCPEPEPLIYEDRFEASE